MTGSMSNVTRILSAIEPATPTPPSSCCRWSTTSCASSRPRSWPRRSRARRSRPPPWCMRHICGWSAIGQPQRLEQPRAFLRRRGRGHAPHPHRPRPAQESRQGAAAAGIGSTGLLVADQARKRTVTRLLTRRRPASTEPAGTAQGRAGQTPLLHRPDPGRGRRRAGVARPPPDRWTGLSPAAWLCASTRSRRSDGSAHPRKKSARRWRRSAPKRGTVFWRPHVRPE